jgi:hypothetical protein
VVPTGRDGGTPAPPAPRRRRPGLQRVPTVIQGERCDLVGRWAGQVVTSFDNQAVTAYDPDRPNRRQRRYRPGR